MGLDFKISLAPEIIRIITTMVEMVLSWSFLPRDAATFLLDGGHAKARLEHSFIWNIGKVHEGRIRGEILIKGEDLLVAVRLFLGPCSPRLTPFSAEKIIVLVIAVEEGVGRDKILEELLLQLVCRILPRSELSSEKALDLVVRVGGDKL